MNDHRFTIGKLDAARRQLEAAILLYFNEADSVATHSLAAAAHEILKDLSSKAGSQMLLERSLVQLLGEKLARALGGLIRIPQNFFKHADRDPDAVLEFSPGLTELILLDGAVQYYALTGEEPLMLRAFIAWYAIQRPEFLKHTPVYKNLVKAHGEITQLGRRDFLSEFTQASIRLAPNSASAAGGSRRR